jgi:hypothetical protein
VLPWAFVWTGFIALRTASVRQHDLLFDEEFRGWGVEDLEWGYRIAKSGIRIELRDDICGFHLPHPRDLAANMASETKNFRYFLSKWPGPGLELTIVFGEMRANRLFEGFTDELAALDGGRQLGTVRGLAEGKDTVVLGVTFDEDQRPPETVVEEYLHGCQRLETWPLVGLALPFDDKSVADCRILPTLARLSRPYWEAVLAEASRVARSVVVA